MFMDWDEKLLKAARLGMRRRARRPREIQIELTNRCNSGCRMCPHTTAAVPEVDLPMDLLDLLLEGTAPIPHVVLTGWGEPLLHPSFIEIIARIRETWPSSAVRFTTNGLLLDRGLAHVLLARDVEGITISIDLWPELDVPDSSLASFFHPPSKRVVQHVRQLADLRGTRKRPIIRLQTIALPVTNQHTRRIIDLAGECGLDEVNLVRLVPDTANRQIRPPWPQEQQLLAQLIDYGKEAGVSVRSVNRQPGWLRMIRRDERFCLKTDDSVYVTVDGDITPCCNLRGLRFGNLRDCSGDILRPWKNPRWEEFFVDQRPACGRCDALAYPYLDRSAAQSDQGASKVQASRSTVG